MITYILRNYASLPDVLIYVWATYKTLYSVLSLLLIFYNETTFFRYVLGIIENRKIKLSWKDYAKQFFVKRILK